MGERWDRDRFMFERSRDERSRMGDDDRFTMRGGRGGRDFSPPDDRRDRRPRRSFGEDDTVRDRRYYEEDYRPMPRRERSPGFDRSPLERVVLEKEPPRRRPNFLRRQSSLDTFDRPHPIFHQREEYGPPARREDFRRDDYRAPPYMPIPLPKTKALPPPQFDEDFPQERVHEREMVRHRRRGRSRDRETSRSVRSSSSSSSSSSSNSSGGTTVRSEYPKKGKTRIPAKLVSRQALIDLSYPFYEEGNTIVVLKALGQDNIDELLKVSEAYKKLERSPDKPKAALPAPEKEKEKAPEKKPPAQDPAPPAKDPAPPAPPADAPKAPPPAPAPAPPAETIPAPPAAPPAAPPVAPPPVARAPPVVVAPPPPPPAAPPVAAPPFYQIPPQPRPAPPPAPVIVTAPPPPSESSVSEWVEEQYYREYSPTRSTTTTSSWDTRHSHHHRHRREKSAPVAIGPMALVNRSRSRSKSRSGREIRAEIRALERELAHRPKGGYVEREAVRAERLPDGQLVVYEEEVEDVVTHHKPPRIEKDKKGRMSISVPRRR